MAKRWGRFVVENLLRVAGATGALFRSVTLTPGLIPGQALALSRLGAGILRNAACRPPPGIPRERAVREPPLRRAPFALRKGRGTSDIFRASGGNAAASGTPCERAVREPPLRRSSPFTRERDVYFLNWQPFRPGHPPLASLRWLAPPSLCERGGWC